MRCERGIVWDEKRVSTVRRLLASGVPREAVAMRLGLNRKALTEAIRRFNLDPKQAA